MTASVGLAALNPVEPTLDCLNIVSSRRDYLVSNMIQ